MVKDKMYSAFQSGELWLYITLGFKCYPYISSPLCRRAKRAVQFERLDRSAVSLLYRISAVRRGYVKYSKEELLRGVDWEALPERWKLSVSVTLVESGLLKKAEALTFIHHYFSVLQRRVEATVSGVCFYQDPFELVVDGELAIISRGNDVFVNTKDILRIIGSNYGIETLVFENELRELENAIENYYSR